MKKIYVSYDVVAEELIDSFIRKNDRVAIRDFIQAFRQQARDDTHVKLYEAYPSEPDPDRNNSLEGIPVREIWDSVEFEKSNKENEE